MINEGKSDKRLQTTSSQIYLRETVTEEEDLTGSDEEQEESKHSPVNDNKFLLVEISDTGAGMEEEIKKKCFTLFGSCKVNHGIN